MIFPNWLEVIIGICTSAIVLMLALMLFHWVSVSESTEHAPVAQPTEQSAPATEVPKTP